MTFPLRASSRGGDPRIATVDLVCLECGADFTMTRRQGIYPDRCEPCRPAPAGVVRRLKHLTGVTVLQADGRGVVALVPHVPGIYWFRDLADVDCLAAELRQREHLGAVA